MIKTYLQLNLQPCLVYFKIPFEEDMEIKMINVGFDKTIQDFEKFAREIFIGGNEIEKTKLHKKLEEFLTFKEYYKKKQDLGKLENVLTICRKRQIEKNESSNNKKSKIELSRRYELPNEIWLKVMSFLKASDLLQSFNIVCKLFYHLSLDAMKSIGHYDQKYFN